MGLFRFKKKPPVRVVMRPSTGEALPDTGGDEIKPLSYYAVLQKEVKPLEDILVGFSSSLPGIKGVDNRIQVLQSLIAAYYDLRSKCVSLGPEYRKYFSDMWEHLHNAHNDDFCFVTKYEEELKYLSTDRDAIHAKEEFHDSQVRGLEDKILHILQEHKEISQTDIYQYFDPIIQKDIQSILYFMAKEGRIKREKRGRTYQITLLR